MKRVVQISFDIAIDNDYDTDLIIEALINSPNMDDLLGGQILGVSFADDVTDAYKNGYWEDVLNDEKVYSL